MPKFAHIADCHLGAFRDKTLQELSIDAFLTTLDLCREENVDFVVFSGDIFHTTIPNMDIVSAAAEKLKELCDSGIRIYAIYGSHDYNPGATSIMDVLQSAGLFHKIALGQIDNDGILRLQFTQDPKTQAKLIGISARKVNLERKYYQILDRESMENEPGFKIFAFHTALSELKPRDYASMAANPISLLPKSFNYYAGGHIHKNIIQNIKGLGHIVYPGPTFAANFIDLEVIAKGGKRGFYLIHFDDEVEEVEFREIPTVAVCYEEYDASGKTSHQVQIKLNEMIEALYPEDKIVLLKVTGQMAGGTPADIDFGELQRTLIQKGALHVRINRYGLRTLEIPDTKILGESSQEIEQNLFREHIDQINVMSSDLKEELGVQRAIELLRITRQEKDDEETKAEYENRITEEATDLLLGGDQK